MLQLKVNPGQEIVYLNQSLNLAITLTNTGDSALLINKRMAVGYENSISRELYAAVVDETNPENETYSPVKINRNDPLVADYGFLQSGDSISSKFDFFHYYHPKKQGKYKIVFYYQADEPLKNCPQNVWKGIVVSEPITIEILPGRMPEVN